MPVVRAVKEKVNKLRTDEPLPFLVEILSEANKTLEAIEIEYGVVARP